MKNKKTKGNLTNNQTAPVLQRSHSIASGSHQRRYYEKGTWENYSALFYFQANCKYTFELTDEDDDFWYFMTYEDGTITARQGNMMQQDNRMNAVPVEVIAIPKKP